VRRLLRPTTLILLSAALALGVAALALWPGRDRASAERAVPRPVPPGDQEVVWLYAATQTESWERLVTGIRRLASDAAVGLEVVDDSNVFPTQSTTVPELAVTLGRSRHRLWFRWYKLTSDQNTHDWVDVLTRRQPPPLAIIGGGSSDKAHELARELNGVRNRLAAPPLLMITTGTADEVPVEQNDWEKGDLMSVYPDRTFRFCFNNTQMARSVSNFIWSQPELRPDGDPAYLPVWQDDPYSRDLADRFQEVLRLRSIKAGARTWAWQTGQSAVSGFPLELAASFRNDFPLVSRVDRVSIAHSIGTFSQPNEWEALAAERIINDYGSQHSTPHRALLALSAPASQPARRFLRGLLRTAPAHADSFVVAMGDSFDFNTVYRDRNVTWLIQDVPFNLVFFCHRNPVDPIAFAPDRPGSELAAPDPSERTSTGTDYLILYRDIAEALSRGAYLDGSLVPDADRLRRNLHAARLKGGRLRFDGDGRELFDSRGNRPSNTGECVVWLEPLRSADNRVLPQARLRIYRSDSSSGQRWAPVPIAGQPELILDYGPDPLAAAAAGGAP
jgi:hypothetical protein